MTLQGVTYKGPELATPEKLANLPGDLIEILWQVNGFVAYAGGLHVRGMVDEPGWHSLDRYWSGEMALHELFREVQPYDVPFGQDCLGDQFLLRDCGVFRLSAETGEVRDLNLDLPSFLDECRKAPVEFLSLQPLAQYRQEKGALKPGEIIHAYPPFCVRESGVGVSMRAVPADDAITFLADFSRQIQDAPDGAEVRIRLSSPGLADRSGQD